MDALPFLSCHCDWFHVFLLFDSCYRASEKSWSTSPLVSSWLSDIPHHFLPERTHVISIFCPQTNSPISRGCEDEQSVSQLEDFHTHYRSLMSLPTLQQRRPLTNWLCRKRSPQVYGTVQYTFSTHTTVHTHPHLVLDVYRKVADVPDLKPARGVSRDQGGVFRLIWTQGQHTLICLLWSEELAWKKQNCTLNIKKSRWIIILTVVSVSLV